MLLLALLFLGLRNGIEGARDTSYESWEIAKKACNVKGSHLPTITAKSNVSSIVQTMKKHDIDNIWLAITKSRNDTWIWLDDTIPDKEFTDQLWEDDKDCGVYHLKDRALEVDRCSEGALGYLCEDKGHRNCGEFAVPASNCSQVEGRTFVYLCGAANWYDARYRCQKIGAEIAIMKRESVMRSLNEKWFDPNSKSCMRLWIGLRRREWIYKGIDNNTDLKETMPNFWAKGEPSDRGYCAIISLQRESGHFGWYSKRCTSRQNYMCWTEKDAGAPERPNTIFHKQKNVSMAEELTTPPKNTTVPSTERLTTFGQHQQRAEPTRKSREGRFLGPVVGAICGVGALIATVITGICIYMRRKKAQKKDYKPGPRLLERIPADEFHSILQNANFKNDDIHYFNIKGGKLVIPKSKIVLDIPHKAMPEEDDSPIGCKIHLDLGQYKIPTAERIVCPVPEFRAPGKFLNPVTVKIPHNITEQGLKGKFKVYHCGSQTNALVPIGSTEQDNQPWFEVKHKMVHIYTTDIGTFICTWPRKELKGLGYCCMLRAKYTEPDVHQQELTVEVCVLDRIYAMVDFLKPLGDGCVSKFHEISLPEGFSEEQDLLLLKFYSPEMNDWEYVNHPNTDDPSIKEVRLSKLTSGDEDMVLNLLGRFVVSRSDKLGKRDSMEVNLQVFTKKVSGDMKRNKIMSLTKTFEFKTCKQDGK